MIDPHTDTSDAVCAFAEPATHARGAPPGHRRFSAIPPLPSGPRRELDVLAEVSAPVGGVLWRALTDVVLWSMGSPGTEERLFRPSAIAWAVSDGATPNELVEPLRVLHGLYDDVYTASGEAIAEACSKISVWSELHAAKETALQFAEAAAFVGPENPARCATAGRLCRRAGVYPRAAMWYRRAIRLSRRDRDEISFTIAHLGHGNLEMDRGRYREAEAHFWKAARNALRIGRTSLAGAAFHDLLAAAIHLGRAEDATEYARRAIRYYLRNHPRFPLLAHDIAFLWLKRGYFSSALPILEQALPLVGAQRERILVLASLARSAAAVHDRIRFERAAREVLALAEADAEMSASSLYHVAEGARTLEEWSRAEALARRAADEAIQRGNATVCGLAQTLLAELAKRTPGDVDEVPEQGGAVDMVSATVLRKLRRQAGSHTHPDRTTPERYPIG